MKRSQVIRLNPTPQQEVYFRKACGVARHADNWALARWKQARAEGQRVNTRELKAEYNRIKHEQFPWCKEVTKCAPEQEFANLGQAFENYWRMKEEGTQPKLKHRRLDGEEAGFPQDDHACGQNLCLDWPGRPQHERHARQPLVSASRQ